MKGPDQLTQLFRARGLKVTPQRQCIFTVLHDNDTHPTAERVYLAATAVMPTISLKTVYQTLNDLAEMGEIASLEVGTGSVRFDPNVEAPHPHLVCERCGKVRDLAANFGDLTVPDSQRQGFIIESTEIVFRGVCSDCSAHQPLMGSGDALTARRTYGGNPALAPGS